ncbi:hypothetical protein BBJ29_009711 [Phytophthora kernoviae]|uniref:Bidirectional sugar transporter SWEET n=1 Tax=Phytophthora kernoviae TaxID=325452 RepID=A0A3R7K498_9STRA|nr:hypothetical protein BBJ29_009711 [Phytophthora kernoviae]
MGVWFVVLKAATSIAAMTMCLSPIPSVHNIYKTKDTGEVAVLPLVALWISCHLWMIYGYVTNDIFPLLATYLVGEVLAACYVAVHFRYTKFRTYTIKAVAFALVFTAFGTTYAVLGREGVTSQNLSAVGNIMGWITAGGSFLLYTSPFETIKRVLQTKSGASIPIALCCAGCVSNLLWILYGLVVNDMFVFGLGVFCTTLPLVQIMLYFLFNPKRQLQSSPPVTNINHSISDNKTFEAVVTTPDNWPLVSTTMMPSATTDFQAVLSPV